MNFQIIYVTTQNHEEAEKIASILLKQKLCACVNIIDGMTSMFFWNEKVQKEKESILIAKTKVDLTDEVIQVIKENHSYDCPCIIALPIIDGDKDFLQWIQKSTKKE